MTKKNYQEVCNSIAKISPYIRFVGVVGKNGELLSYYRRPKMKPLLSKKKTHDQFSHIAMKTDMEAFFDKSLGEIQFVWEERKKVQTISFAIKKIR
ncbi:MAG: hypothetical protein ACE5RJ_03395, partial [Nitrosopumilaceae archaeon]